MFNKILSLNGKDFPIGQAATCPMGFPKETEDRNKKLSYYTGDFGTFDIETTSCITEKDKDGRFQAGYGYMYIWQFYSKTTGLVMGRTWIEFIGLLNRIVQDFSSKKPYFVIYVHNLAFEFAFMADQLALAGMTGEVFAIKNRKIITYRMNNRIEFRCSLKLTGRGLNKYLKDMPAGYEKLVGNLDYRVQRTPKSVLTDEELSYCAVDVIGLWHSLKLDMQTTRDSIATIPLTITGYVRRDFKQTMKNDKQYSYLLARSALTTEQFRMVRRLAKGGDTLASCSQILWKVHKGVGSFDFKSSYPAQMLTKKFPIGKLEYEGQGIDLDEEILERIELSGRFFITEFVVFGLRLKDPCTPIPCISMSTCDYLDSALYFNGRVLKAERLSIAMDMVSYGLFQEQYCYESIQFGKTYSCEYDYLPDKVRDIIYQYFEKKCRLDDTRKKYPKGSKERENLEIDYAIAKSRLNSLYGMMYTSPLRDVNTFKSKEGEDIICKWGNEYTPALTMDEMNLLCLRFGWNYTEAEREELIKENQRKLYQSQCYAAGLYLWGVMVASHGRKALNDLIKAIGKYNIIYSDTDSGKCIYTPDVLERVNALNESLKKLAIEQNAFCDTGENVYYLGIAEDETEGEPYLEFITGGAKKYAYRDKDGIHITVSGVQKEMAYQLDDDISKLKDVTFNPAGGIMLHYIEQSLQIVHVTGDDGTEDEILLGNNICCEERIYSVSDVTDERKQMEYLLNFIPVDEG